MTANQGRAWRRVWAGAVFSSVLGGGARGEANFSCTTTNTHTFRSRSRENIEGARIDLYFLGSVDSACRLLRGLVPSQKKTATNHSPYIPVSLIHFHSPCAAIELTDRPIFRSTSPTRVRPGQDFTKTMPKLDLCATHLLSPWEGALPALPLEPSPHLPPGLLLLPCSSRTALLRSSLFTPVPHSSN